MSEFEAIQKEDFEKFLDSLDLEFQDITGPGSSEYIYGTVVDDFRILIYSSISKHTGKARHKGGDAIRVHIYASDVDGVIFQEPDTRRIATWRKNLKKKIKSARNRIPTVPECPECGITMQERERKADGKKFWGCPNFPECKMTLDIN